MSRNAQGARTLTCEIGVQAVWQAKQLQCLIDEMRSKVEPDSAAGPGSFAPAAAHFGTEPVDMRFEVRNLADQVVGERTPYAQKIAVPASVVKHRE